MIGGFGKCSHVTQEKDNTYLGEANLFQLGVILSVASALLFASPPLRSADAESKDRYTK